MKKILILKNGGNGWGKNSIRKGGVKNDQTRNFLNYIFNYACSYILYSDKKRDEA